MRFDYEYRTSDNAPHTGTLSAPTRDAAFAALKSRGIHPSRVTESPGFFNRLFGRGKRWLVIVFLAILLVVVLVVIKRNVGLDALIEPQTVREDDAEVVERLKNAGHSTEDTERFLAERRRMEETYRAKIIKRVERGELTADDAAALLRSMGIK